LWEFMVGTSRCDVRTAQRAVPTSGNEITPEKYIEVVRQLHHEDE